MNKFTNIEDKWKTYKVAVGHVLLLDDHTINATLGILQTKRDVVGKFRDINDRIEGDNASEAYVRTAEALWAAIEELGLDVGQHPPASHDLAPSPSRASVAAVSSMGGGVPNNVDVVAEIQERVESVKDAMRRYASMRDGLASIVSHVNVLESLYTAFGSMLISDNRTDQTSRCYLSHSLAGCLEHGDEDGGPDA